MYNIPNYNDIEIFGPPWRSVGFEFEDDNQIQMVVDWCNENFDQEWTVRIRNDYNKPNIMSSLLSMSADDLRDLGSSSKSIHEAVSTVSKSMSDDSSESEFDKFDRFYFKNEESMMAFKLRWL